MSEDNSVNLFGASGKELAMIIMFFALGLAFVIVGVAFMIAILNAPDDAILITGSFDLGQWQSIVIGIAVVAVTMVAQQLTKKDNAALLAFMERMLNGKSDEKGKSTGNGTTLGSTTKRS